MDLAFLGTKKPAVKPKALVCYICGREYGTRSLEIHIKSCAKKWDNEQSKLPKSKRKPCPQAPAGFANMIRLAQGKKPWPDQAMPHDEQTIEQYNQTAGETANNLPMGGARAAAAIAQYNDQAYKNWDQNILEPCPHCARTFLPDSLKYHLKACTAEKPLKKRLVRSGEADPDAEEEKTPNLGLAARIAAAERQGKIAPSPQKQKT